MATKTTAKKAVKKTQYYYANSTYLDNVEGPFDSLAAAKDHAHNDGYDEFTVFTFQGKYKVKTSITFEEVK